MDAYQIKYSFQHIHVKGNWIQLLIGILAFAFESIGIYMAGLQYLLLCSIAYIPGFFLFMHARKDAAGSKWFNKLESLLTMAVISSAILRIVLFSMGRISI